jgi:ectoine hydroxylase-related dioxygenase (phytanoyl-CoA dioxygenase family)
MLKSPEPPPRPLSATEVEAYQRDGVICIRQLYSHAWRERLERAIEQVRERGTLFGQMQSMGNPRFRNDLFLWKLNDDIRDFVLFGPSAHLARQVFGSQRVGFFYDQIFIKEAQTDVPTPWHHDATFWPVAGSQICSLWTSLDPVTVESSALEFIAGSHRWPNRFKAVTPDYNPYMLASDLEEMPDIDAQRERYRILSWEVEPGDAILFDALAVHGSKGNTSKTRRRRAITTRWVGDDVVYAPRKAVMPILWTHGLQPGDPLAGPAFPQVLPEIDQAAIAQRMRGPEEPDPALIAAMVKQAAATAR